MTPEFTTYINALYADQIPRDRYPFAGLRMRVANKQVKALFYASFDDDDNEKYQGRYFELLNRKES